MTIPFCGIRHTPPRQMAGTQLPLSFMKLILFCYHRTKASVYRGNIAVKACPNACRLCLERLDGSLKFSACDRASGKADDTAFLAGSKENKHSQGRGHSAKNRCVRYTLMQSFIKIHAQNRLSSSSAVFSASLHHKNPSRHYPEGVFIC